MKKNIRILFLFIIVFIISLIINLIPVKSNDSSKNLAYYSCLEQNEITTELEETLKVNNIRAKLSNNDDAVEFKLKYYTSISEEEKDKYDIYTLRNEKLYEVKGKDAAILDVETLKKELDSDKKEIGDQLILFSPNTSNWLRAKLNNEKKQGYVYDGLDKIAINDKTVTAVLFESELQNKGKYNFKNNDKNNVNSEDTLCLLIKRSTISEGAARKVYNEIKKKIND